MLADFESKYLEVCACTGNVYIPSTTLFITCLQVQKLTLTINQTLTEKKEHLQRLESEINTELKAIAERVPSTEK